MPELKNLGIFIFLPYKNYIYFAIIMTERFFVKKQYFISIVIFLLIWQISALIINNDILVPTLQEIFHSLVCILGSSKTYIYISITCLRVLKSFFISLFTALVISSLGYIFENIKKWLQPLMMLIKTIPNISYIILAIIWLGSEGSVSIVTFMILFPIFLQSFDSKLAEQKRKLSDVTRIYRSSFSELLKVVILPQLYIEILETSKTSISMGLKVAVMAEIIAAVRKGIGKQLNYARINLNTADLIAWTVIIIFISIIFNFIFQLLLQYRLKEEQYGKTKCGSSSHN